MKFFLRIICLIAAVIFITVSCTKYVAGPKGDPGTPGASGNLVIKQFSVTVNSSDWSANETLWVADIFSDEITAKVIEKGEVKVYFYTETNWWVLPYGKDYIFTQSSISEGRIRLTTSHVHGMVPPKPPTANYRAVIMAPK